MLRGVALMNVPVQRRFFILRTICVLHCLICCILAASWWKHLRTFNYFRVLPRRFGDFSWFCAQLQYWQSRKHW